MKREKIVRFNVNLLKRHHEELKKLSMKEGKSISRLIREAIEIYLNLNKPVIEKEAVPEE